MQRNHEIQKYCKTYENIYVARCEFAYLDKLIQKLKPYLQNDPFLSREFIDLKNMYQKNVMQLNQLKSTMDKIAIDNDDDLIILEEVREAGHILRQDFSTKHSEFLDKIDRYFATQMNPYNPHINAIIQTAKKYLANKSPDENHTENVEFTINYFEDNRKPLIERLISPASFEKPVNYAEFLTIRERAAHMKSIVVVYDKLLDELLVFIKNKIELRHYNYRLIKQFHNNIQEITGEDPARIPQGIFINEEEKEEKEKRIKQAKVKQENIATVFHFIKENCNFFFAMFSTDIKEQDKVQEWAQACAIEEAWEHASLIKETLILICANNESLLQAINANDEALTQACLIDDEKDRDNAIAEVLSQICANDYAIIQLFANEPALAQACANHEKLTLAKLSNGLKKVLLSKDMLTKFRTVLLGRDENDSECLLAYEDAPLGRFLKHFLSEDLVNLLKEHINNPAIAKWNEYNQTSIHSLSI